MKLKICLTGLAVFSLLRMYPQAHHFAEARFTSSPLYSNAENTRSDTMNILKYSIALEIGNSNNKFIKGYTAIRFSPKISNQSHLRLDLLKLLVDSVKEGSATLNYTYNDTLLKINFLTPKNTSDTSVITVYYHGQPQGDATGWGGFYYNNAQSAQYAYNLGVGFGAKPHNYGRVWFPCFDNFVERSKFEFIITSDSARRAHCNGQLISDVLNGSKRTRTWVLNEEIPSYLACVSLANYTQVNWSASLMNGIVPIRLAAHAADTTALKAGFVNLISALHGFENYYGPYKWNKVGYSLVPFNGGAMEHATNIAYPRFAIGNMGYEDLYVHELSHHWWGDLVTCETPEDMWINEGLASYSAHLFFEWQYNKAAYLNRVRTEHEDLIHFLHLREGGFRAVSGVPHALTYGDHVYKKGADITHTMRGYLGDSAFFAGLKYTLAQKSFKSMNSQEFQALMQTGSGKNTMDFFNNWVLSGGWSHFAFDSVRVNTLGPGSYQAMLSIRQKTFGATALHSNVPLEVSYFKSDWSRVIKSYTLSGSSSVLTQSLSFIPVYVALNYDGKINDASSFDVLVIKSAGSKTFTLGKLILDVSDAGQDSSLVRVVHHMVKPDPFLNNPDGHRLSNQHYWTVEGILSAGFKAKVRFNYNGIKSLSGAYSYLDTALTLVNGDSVSLFYRQDAGQNWSLIKTVSKFKSSSKHGYIDLDSLRLGDYCFGNSTDLTYLGKRENVKSDPRISIYPNPSSKSCVLEIQKELNAPIVLSITSAEGRLVKTAEMQSGLNELDLSALPKGTYLFTLKEQKKLIYTQKIVLE
ncbi:MAG TPA: M1 family aminopeptidase [Bacteroidia bacterium]|nr:M1 family aminopeptidase [Bacteroidia bacterium]